MKQRGAVQIIPVGNNEIRIKLHQDDAKLVREFRDVMLLWIQAEIESIPSFNAVEILNERGKNGK